MNPSHLPARLALARSLHSQHEFDEARRYAEQVVRAEPSSAPALALLGDTHLETGDYDAAERRYGQLADVERSAPVVSRLAG